MDSPISSPKRALSGISTPLSSEPQVNPNFSRSLRLASITLTLISTWYGAATRMRFTTSLPKAPATCTARSSWFWSVTVPSKSSFSPTKLTFIVGRPSTAPMISLKEGSGAWRLGQDLQAAYYLISKDAGNGLSSVGFLLIGDSPIQYYCSSKHLTEILGSPMAC